ncbi:MAG: tryptophan 2,3-dioxygenase [Alphaproteobacteria bacterium]|nr:tryptophan 2,3-dioxygenase [Alphaproteobacteria bacterium]
MAKSAAKKKTPAKKKGGAGDDITYKSYLQLPALLDAQHPISDVGGGRHAHDEMMFIVVHQTYELWFKLVLFELDRIQSVFGKRVVADADMRVVSASLTRIVDILKLLVRQLDIMETMTPLDFLDFRHVFRSASGFQSMQFRELEVRLGLRRDDRIGYNGQSFENYLAADDRAALHAAMKKPALIDQLDKWLSRTPFVEMSGFSFWKSYRKAVADMIEGDRDTVRKSRKMTAQARKMELEKLDNMGAQFALLFDEKEGEARHWRFSQEALQAALLINLYRDQPALQLPFRILNDLMDMDELLALWRYRHALMAQRMLGTKMGSGGSTGHDYLAATASKHRIFKDLFMLSTFLIPRSKLPKLPRNVRDKMGFRYWDKAE